ncbi:MAG: hypothetical protein R3C11_28520 [Planctomycetaceae bacterium]
MSKEEQEHNGFKWSELLIVISILAFLTIMMNAFVHLGPGAVIQFIWVFLTGWLTSGYENLIRPSMSLILVLSYLLIVSYCLHIWRENHRELKFDYEAIEYPRLLSITNFMLLISMTLSCSGIYIWNERSKEYNLVWYEGVRSGPFYVLHSTQNMSIDLEAFLKDQGNLPDYHHAVTTSPEPHSWHTHLLPYMGNESLHQQIQFDKPWYDLKNRRAFWTSLFYYHPENHYKIPTVQQETGYALTPFSANAHIFARSEPITLDDINAADGASSTILIGTIIENLPPWGKPGNWRDPALGINQSPHGFGTPFSQGCYFVMADGSVRLIHHNIDPKVLEALGTPDGGEKLVPVENLPFQMNVWRRDE